MRVRRALTAKTPQTLRPLGPWIPGLGWEYPWPAPAPPVHSVSAMFKARILYEKFLQSLFRQRKSGNSACHKRRDDIFMAALSATRIDIVTERDKDTFVPLSPSSDWRSRVRKIQPSQRSPHTDAHMHSSEFIWFISRPATCIFISLPHRRRAMEMPTHTWTAATHTQILATQDQFFQPPCLADRTAFTACSSGQRQTVSHSTLAFAVVSTRARNVPHGSRSTPSAATSRSNINSVVRCLEFGFVSYRIRIVSHRIASVVLVRASSSASQKAVIRKKEKKSSYSQGKSSVDRTSNRFRRRPEKQKGAQFRPVWRYFFGVPASRIRKNNNQTKPNIFTTKSNTNNNNILRQFRVGF